MTLLSTSRAAALFAALIVCAACGGGAKEPVEIGIGSEPTLPEPTSSLMPTLAIAKPTGWPEGATPVAAEGLQVQAFAAGLDHPRWLHVLPNGDVLVAETDAPDRPEAFSGIRGFFAKTIMQRAGANAPSADRITLLRDADGDGVAELQTPLLEKLNSPFGMALVNGRLYIANTDAVVSAPYADGDTKIAAAPERLTDLPAGPRNHHWTKGLAASPDGTKLYAAVGSNSNIAENGLDEEEGRAAIWEIDVATGDKRLFATGLRNPVGLDFEPRTGALWTAVNERDELGHNLVPDYMTSVQDGGFYGWPWSYWGVADTRVKPPRPDMIEKALDPDYALGAHTASLGLAFADGADLGPRFADGAFVGQHGSWNRKPRSGYKVIFVPFENGRAAGAPIDVLTGFLIEDEALGRPVGVAVAADGALLVADDVGDVIWRVSRAP
jgi:glucose/arabinose dehydrogenase